MIVPSCRYVPPPSGPEVLSLEQPQSASVDQMDHGNPLIVDAEDEATSGVGAGASSGAGPGPGPDDGASGSAPNDAGADADAATFADSDTSASGDGKKLSVDESNPLELLSSLSVPGVYMPLFPVHSHPLCCIRQLANK